MVFKRVLKGIGRLMLTTAVMCGVGLFLCSSEVKAVTVDASGLDGNIIVTVTANQTEIDNMTDTIKIRLLNGTDVLCEKPVEKRSLSADRPNTINIDPTEFINRSVAYKTNLNKVLTSTPGSIPINNVELYDSSVTDEIAQSSCSASTKTICKANMTYKNIDGDISPSVSFTIESFSYRNTTVDADIQYGYVGDTIEVTANPTSPYKLENYYRDYYNDSSRSGNAIDWKWSKDTGAMSIELSSEPGKNDYKVTYLPKIKELKITKPATGKVEVKISDATSMAPSPAPIVEYGISWSQLEETCKQNIEAYIFDTETVKIDNNTLEKLETSEPAGGSFTVTPTLRTVEEKGSGEVTLKATLPGSDGNKFIAQEAIIPVYLSVPASGFTLNSTTVSLMAGVEQKIDIIKGITPAGADQTISNYTFQVEEIPSSTLLEMPSYEATTDKLTLTLKAKPSVTSGTATVQIKLKDRTTSAVLASQTLTVKIISLDKEKTISSINKNNKNYITYNKDKGYSLDIMQLIIDNAKDTSDNTVTITKDQITEVSVGGSLCSDGIWKPSEAALNKKVTCKINGTAISSDSFTVSAYPMPTATYSSSNRTLSVKIPTKVATAYSDDNNIRQSKGFKLILEDSSGNTLYEYTDSKYQNVLSSSSESTVTYTVPAADIEGMVTSAASNGKFSADTTSVKFKVIPMGYKQSSTSDETIKAKDEIAGRTDAVTVYKVSASGTNFTSSAAYGLDGQTVSLTATPNSGYSFKQWSDGNTSNPRQVKVSASGTRAFQAVAGERVANSTGAGGTDNSELYDDVPKTAESNSAIWLIVFMVFAVMGTTYALYLQLKAANSKHDR